MLSVDRNALALERTSLVPVAQPNVDVTASVGPGPANHGRLVPGRGVTSAVNTLRGPRLFDLFHQMHNPQSTET